MFDQLLKQNQAMMQSMLDMNAYEQAMKPMATLLEAQRAMLETMAEQHTAISTELMSDCLDEARAVCQCDSIPDMMEIHKKYLSQYQAKMAELAKHNAHQMTQMSEEALGLMKQNADAFETQLKK
jgi:predicted HAD superfamily phosphohydrolase YqeG